MQANETTAQHWHVAKWGLWGWLETGIKVVGIIAGLIAFLNTPTTSELIIGGNPHLAAVILLGLLTVFTVLALFIRIGQREIVSLIYAIFNLLAHAALVIALVRLPDQGVLPVVFGAAFAVGQAAKLRFLSITGYTEGGQDANFMRNFALAILIAYALFAVLVLL